MKPMKMIYFILLMLFKNKNTIQILICLELFLTFFLYNFFNYNFYLFLLLIILFICSSILTFILVINSIRSFSIFNSNIYLF